jgi:hypothetical protein
MKMLHLLEHGLWIAAPTSAVYHILSNVTDASLKSNYSIADKEGNRYDLEHVVLFETKWGKCIDYVEH